MARPLAVPALDPRLQALLEADDTEREGVCARLVADHVEPVVRGVLRRRLGGSDRDDFEDVRSEVIVQLLARLEDLRRDPAREAIANLEGYAAVVAYHACDRLVGRRHPQRVRLKSRLRYVLTHARDLGLWTGADGAWRAGLAGMERAGGPEDVAGASPPGAPDAPASGERRRRLLADPATAAAAFAGRRPAALRLDAMLTALFRWLGAPLELDELVDVAGHLLGQRDRPPHDLVDVEGLADRGAAPLHAALDQRGFLARMWVELRQLPPRQRAALLLNLREPNGGDVLGALVLTGTTTLRELAGVLELSAEELAALWKDLPLPDAAIAERLGATRQQVVNLRKCARERLARRLGLGKTGPDLSS